MWRRLKCGVECWERPPGRAATFERHITNHCGARRNSINAGWSRRCCRAAVVLAASHFAQGFGFALEVDLGILPAKYAR